jgi:hypothetical protein
MLKCIIVLYEESLKAISDSPAEKRITWSYIKTTLAPLIEKVKGTKFLVSEEALRCHVLSSSRLPYIRKILNHYNPLLMLYSDSFAPFQSDIFEFLFVSIHF